jgi:signal transduction histidine kinase
MNAYAKDSRGEYARALELALLRHEIGRPLAYLSASLHVVRTGLERASASASSVAPLLDAVFAAEASARHALDVVRRIGIDQGAPRESVDLRAVVESTLAIAGEAVKQRASLITELSSVPVVEANSTELRQILLNLLCHAMLSVEDAGEGPHRIRVRVVRKTPSAVALTVENDARNGVFRARDDDEPRIATHQSRGSGLGFAYCTRLVASWGGVFAVETEPGVRTTVSVVLPVDENG